MREWLSVNDILAIGHPQLPRDRRELDRMALDQGWRADRVRSRLTPGVGREGGSWVYHVSLLPLETRDAALQGAHEASANAPTREDPASAQLWRRYEALPDAQKAEARRRLDAVERVFSLSKDMSRQLAVSLVADGIGQGARTVWEWVATAKDYARSDRLAALAPRHAGRTVTAPCDPHAWDFLVADYLRPEQPAFESCERRMREAAAAHGWSPLPSAKTLKRRIDREVPRAVQTLARKGVNALKAAYPHQNRDRAVFHALEAVNADGHKFDVFVAWKDGTTSRAVMVAVQDLYSGTILGHRLDRTENWSSVRLAFADAIESYGLFTECWLDNGRNFASKWITGRQATRYRFKIKDDEPEGLLTGLGVRVHWTTPYHGQAKPIERAFRDLCEEIAKHPRCSGAYTGNSPTNKPSNYGATAIPEDEFRALVANEIVRHNTRQGRGSRVCNGRSFHEALKASLEQPSTMVRKASAAQLRSLLLAAEGVTVRKPDGSIYLGDNRYWHERLTEHLGKKLTVRFDPDDLLQNLAVYTLDGRFVCEAEVIEATGFNDVAAAQEHARRKRAWLKAQREMLTIQQRMSLDDLVRVIPAPAAPEPMPQPSVVRLVANGAPRTEEPVEREDVWSGAESFGRAMRLVGGADHAPSERRD